LNLNSTSKDKVYFQKNPYLCSSKRNFYLKSKKIRLSEEERLRYEEEYELLQTLLWVRENMLKSGLITQKEYETEMNDILDDLIYIRNLLNQIKP
jgi:hypothetical protein